MTRTPSNQRAETANEQPEVTGQENRSDEPRRRPQQPQGERGGPKGPEPTRFGDWEKNGRCFDF